MPLHTARCSLILCWNMCYCIHQHIYSSALFTHFGWRGADEEIVRILLIQKHFSPQSFHCQCAQSAPTSLVLATPGSAPLHLRRAGLTSAACVEECHECCLYHTDSVILAGSAPRQSNPLWCFWLRLIFRLRCFKSLKCQQMNIMVLWYAFKYF